MPAPRRRSTSDRLDPELDARILEAVADALAEQGYEGMSIESVAARAGVGKASIYRRWEGKPALVLEAVYALDMAPRDPPDTGSLRGDLLAVLEDLRASLDPRGAAIFAGVLVAMRNDPGLVRAVHERLLTRWSSITGQIVDRAVGRGEIGRPAPELLELFGHLAPSMLSLRVLAQVGELDERFSRQLVDSVLLPVLGSRP